MNACVGILSGLILAIVILMGETDLSQKGSVTAGDDIECHIAWGVIVGTFVHTLKNPILIAFFF